MSRNFVLIIYRGVLELQSFIQQLVKVMMALNGGTANGPQTSSRCSAHIAQILHNLGSQILPHWFFIPFFSAQAHTYNFEGES